jgi:hypothetical protein
MDLEYIPKNKLSNVRNYKYSGVDNSITYEYIISPLCQWIVENIIPSWMAPNLVFFLKRSLSLGFYFRYLDFLYYNGILQKVREFYQILSCLLQDFAISLIL